MIRSSNFEIRPHHSLCIQFFIGKGYNKEFVLSMTEIIRELDQNDPVVELTDKCDVICRECPNNINGVCLSEQKVTAIDNRCIQKYGLSFGESLHWSKLKYLAFEKIINCRKLEEVCENCQWLEICRSMNKILHDRL